MKNAITGFGVGLAVIVGVKVGEWLWDEFLEEKLTDFKDYVICKKDEKGS